jgi:mRNA-degrading endonuclease RelE of RelBE toxin-antitoxin system
MPSELLFTDEFQRNLRILAKKYRHIKSDLQPTLTAISQGDLIGDQIPGLGLKGEGKPYCVYKVRIANSDANRGKSGGYRLIYDATESEKVILLIVYSKSEKENVKASELKEILDSFAIAAAATSTTTE